MKKLNYEIRKNGEFWDLYESQTEHVVGTYDSVQSAQIAKTHMNRGGGFGGWTPAFMLRVENNFNNSLGKF